MGMLVDFDAKLSILVGIHILRGLDPLGDLRDGDGVIGEQLVPGREEPFPLLAFGIQAVVQGIEIAQEPVDTGVREHAADGRSPAPRQSHLWPDPRR